MKLLAELREWLDKQEINPETIGTIRRRCFLPWGSQWNAIVRKETADREKSIEEKTT